MGEVARRLGSIRHSRPPRRGATKARESDDCALSHPRAGELGRWARGIGEALAERVDLGVRMVEAGLDITPVIREQHGQHDGGNEKGDGRQRRQISRRSFHDRLPGHDCGRD